MKRRQFARPQREPTEIDGFIDMKVSEVNRMGDEKQQTSRPDYIGQANPPFGEDVGCHPIADRPPGSRFNRGRIAGRECAQPMRHRGNPCPAQVQPVRIPAGLYGDVGSAAALGVTLDSHLQQLEAALIQ